MQVSNNLRDIRYKEYALDQKEFSELLGVSNTLYNKWERQRSQPSLEFALLIAKRLNRPVEEIFYLSE